MKTRDLIKKSKGVLLNKEVSIPNTFASIKTDTRTIQKGDIFVALKGPSYDGHDYIDEAIKKGASMIFVMEECEASKVPIVKVENTYDALFDLASCYLEESQAFVIAITGSTGKTTTKELIASILEKKYQVLKSEGNKNNRIGIPETLFQLKENIDCLVLELGMNHLHEIEALSKLVKPNIAVITNIGSAHIGYLGSKKNIFKAKMEIVSGMNGGLLIVNGKDKYLSKIKKIEEGRIEKVELEHGEIQIEIKEQTLFGSTLSITDGISSSTIFFKCPGKAIIDDVLLALSVGKNLEVPFDDMIEVLKKYEPLNQRLTVKRFLNGNILINDAYNASLESVMMDLELLNKSKEHKIIILGDILELGSSSKKIHRKVGKEVKKIENAEIYFIGSEMKYAWEKCKNGKYFKTKEDFILNFEDPKINPSIILIKGSRKMKLETLISYVEKETE